MSLYSYSTISSPRWSESSNSYCLLPSSSSITTVSSQSGNERQSLTTGDEQPWPVPPVQDSIVQNHWRIEKKIFLKDQQSNRNDCILKATMTKNQILLHDSSSTQPTLIPGKHILMKVAFNF